MKYFLFMLVFAFVGANAQEEYYDYEAALDSMEYKPKYSVFGNYNLNYHSVDFRSLPNVLSCCPRFTSGFGSGLLFGISYDYPLHRDLFVGGRLGLHIFSADLSKLETVDLIIDGTSTKGQFEHAVQANFTRLQFFPNVSYRLLPQLFLHSGLDLSVITSADYKQIEVIKEPADRGTFINGLRYQNKNEGEIENINSFNMNFRLGASYELPLNKTNSLRIAPEAFYNFWLMPTVKERKWNIHQFDLGVSIRYTQPPPPPPPPIPPPPPPMPYPALPGEPPELVATVRAVEIDERGRENPNFSIRLEDFTSLNMRPILNFIFFSENSYTIPDRYIKLSPELAKKFTLRSIESSDALETYYNVLNILGRRLADNPQISITIVGSNAHKGIERNNRELSMARANAVKSYFTDVWNIDEKRIAVNARNLPRQATDSDEEGADDENRRVEILSNSNSLYEPVITGDTIRVLSNTTIRFYPNSDAQAGIKEWKLTVNFNNAIAQEFTGKGKLPEFIDWALDNDNPAAPHRSGILTYTLSVFDNLNQSFETRQQRIPIEQITVDRKRLEQREDTEYEYYRLILFDYASSNLRAEHRQVVDFIKDRITPKSKVTITGFTDKIGKEDVNLRISTQRANAVARRMNIPGSVVRGVGESQLLYPNDLPEARFYCRTVTIMVETKVSE